MCGNIERKSRGKTGDVSRVLWYNYLFCHNFHPWSQWESINTIAAWCILSFILNFIEKFYRHTFLTKMHLANINSILCVYVIILSITTLSLEALCHTDYEELTLNINKEHDEHLLRLKVLKQMSMYIWPCKACLLPSMVTFLWLSSTILL